MSNLKVALGRFTDLGQVAVLLFIYLVVMGSLVAFSAYAWLLANTSMAVATSYAFVNPVIALFLGVAFAHETIGRTVPLAVALVLGGLFLVLRKPSATTITPSLLPLPPETGQAR